MRRSVAFAVRRRKRAKATSSASLARVVVTSCAPCNLRKGNRLLDEVSMTLSVPPRPPTPVLFIRLASPTIPTGWRPYLSALEPATAAAA